MNKLIFVGIRLSGRGCEIKKVYDPCLPSVSGYLTVRDYDYDENNEIVPKDRYELVALDHIKVITVSPEDLPTIRFALGRRYEVKVSDRL